ncbi:MAG TPA: Flp pilus assembly protein CpaB [Rhodospirillales bacterium]
MRVLIVGIIVLALAVAGVSTYLIRSFGSKDKVAELQKQAEKPKIRVLIATKPLKPGDTLKPDTMAWQAWVEEALNPQFISVTKADEEGKKLKDMTGRVVRFAINVGEPILQSKTFKRDNAGFLAGTLKSGMRAVAFSVSANTASAGFILPNDRVDILLTHDKAASAVQKRQKGSAAGDPGAPLLVLSQTTETILRDVRVLAIDQALSTLPEQKAIPNTRTITLELTPKQAELLTTARAMGKLSLVLRSLEAGKPDDRKILFTTDVEVSPFLSNLNEILEEQKEMRERELAEQRKGQGTTKSAPKKKDTVKIFRGGKGGLSEVTAK